MACSEYKCKEKIKRDLIGILCNEYNIEIVNKLIEKIKDSNYDVNE